MSYHPSALLTALFLLAPATARAQELAPAPVPDPSLTIPRLEQAPVIDGSLDDPAWGKAAQVGEFLQFTPKQGQAFTEKTVAYAGYDADNLYVAFRAFDSEPAKIRTHLAPRDRIFGDDWVMLGLDTFGDRRRAYEFVVNPLGIQLDIFSLAGSEDTAPDFVWQSAGKLLPDGYSVELRIPFKSLRFQKAAEQPWRAWFMRNIQRKNEKGCWPPFYNDKGTLFSQMAEFKGIRDARPGMRLELMPEVTGIRTMPYERQENAGHIGQWNVRSGGNVRYGLTPNWTLDSAFNPDFSQVEADQPQVQVNQRYALFYAEKRPFFMEGADLFSTPLRLFHTRAIVDPEYGVKLTGKQGPFSAAALMARDRSAGGSTFDLLRMSGDIGKESSLGLSYSGKESGPRGSNRVAAVDGRFRLGKVYSLELQEAESYSRRPGMEPARGAAFSGTLVREARDLGFQFSYTDVSRDFEAGSGFVNRVDMRNGLACVWHKFWQKEGPLIYWMPQAGYRRIYDTRSVLTDENPFASLTLSFPLQTFVYLEAAPATLERYEGVDFRKRSWSFQVDSQPTSFFSTTLSGSAGKGISYDSDPPVLGNSSEGSASVTLKPDSRLSLEQLFIKSRLDTESGDRIYDENIARTKATYQLSRNLSCRLMYQYATLGHSGFADALLGYTPTPGTAVYAGYDISFSRDSGTLRRTREVFFTKVSYLFRL